MDKINRMGVGVSAFVVGLLGMAGAAFADADGATTTAVQGAATTLKDTIEAALPIILVVAVAWVVLHLAKRLVHTAGG